MSHRKQQNNEWLGGVVVPVVTPLTENESLDEEAMGKILTRLLTAGVHGIFVMGSVGEGPMLNSRVVQQVLKLTVEIVGNRAPVLAGASDNSTHLVLERLNEMTRHGVKAGVCTTPYYGWHDNEKATIEFFTTIADKSPIPIVIYNLPRATGICLRPETVRKLYGHPNIVGIKDTNNDLAAMEYVAGDPDRSHNFRYLFGNSSFCFQLFQAGADGVVCAPANVLPQLAVELYRKYRQGELDIARQLGVCLAELCQIFNYPTTCGAIKAALELQGICSRRTVHPWPQASQQDMSMIDAILQKVQNDFRNIKPQD